MDFLKPLKVKRHDPKPCPKPETPETSFGFHSSSLYARYDPQVSQTVAPVSGLGYRIMGPELFRLKVYTIHLP